MTSIEEYATKIHDNIKKKEIEDIILDTIMKNNLKSRLEISNYYKRTYGISLFEEIQTKVKGDFGDCACQLFLSPLDFCIHHLKLGLKKSNECAMEMLTSKTPEELKIIENAYKKDTGKDLKTDITKAFSGAIGKNLLNLFVTQRETNPKPNKTSCEKWATDLSGIDIKKWTEDENLFKEIFIKRSPEEIILIARYYLKITGNNMIDVIEKKTSGKSQILLKEILYNNIMPHERFADKIYIAIKGAGTDEELLSRALVSRCELDMAAIRDIYPTKYKETLKEAIIGDTSGNYQKLCVFLVEK
jgi:hypothetical protein